MSTNPNPIDAVPPISPYVTDGWTLNTWQGGHRNQQQSSPQRVNEREFATLYGATLAIGIIVQNNPGSGPWYIQRINLDNQSQIWRQGPMDSPKPTPLYQLTIRSRNGRIGWDAALVYEITHEYPWCLPDLFAAMLADEKATKASEQALQEAADLAAQSQANDAQIAAAQSGTA